MKKYHFFILSFFLILFSSCHDKNSFLENYFEENTGLHDSIYTEMTQFCKRYQTVFYITRFSDDVHRNQGLNVNMLVAKDATYYQVFYDSLFQRQPSNNPITDSFQVPVSLLKEFERSAYKYVSARSSGVFFVHKPDNNGMFARDVTYRGIMMFSSEWQTIPEGKRIAPNAVITTSYYP
ncbi:MAG: hypothetical protein NTW29_07485 [Bacteroidetes bacterium]|nr:hypothetical protein [Bacteroidota bacterium]